MKHKIISLVTDACSSPVDESSRFDALGLDSLEFLCLIQDVEKEFSLKISDEAIAKINTVADLIKAVGA